MRASSAVLLEILRVQLWVVPAIAALLAAAFAVLLAGFDSATGSLGLPLDIDAGSARAVLSAISGAMISFTALVFSVTMLVLQTASTQLSPRVVRTFLRDRFNQVVMGLFVATFVFSLLMSTAVSEAHVPQLGVLAAVGLVLVAVMAFVVYIDHMAHDIRPTSVIESITNETRAVIERVYPEGAQVAPVEPNTTGSESDADGLEVTWSGPAGYVQAFDQKALLAFADEHGGAVELHTGIGGFLVTGRPLLTARGRQGHSTTAAEAGLEDGVAVGPERTMTEDPEFGFRQLVDVALRALSPSLNDPSTASQVVNRLHELLLALQPRDIPSPVVLGEGSAPPVIVPAPDWDAYVHLATSEIGAACRTLPQVRRQVAEMIESLMHEATPEQRPALRRAQAELEGLDSA